MKQSKQIAGTTTASSKSAVGQTSLSWPWRAIFKNFLKMVLWFVCGGLESTNYRFDIFIVNHSSAF